MQTHCSLIYNCIKPKANAYNTDTENQKGVKTRRKQCDNYQQQRRGRVETALEKVK